MYKFKITYLQQLLVFSHTLLSLMLVIGVSYFVWGGLFNNTISISAIIIILLLDTLPAFLLHIQYLLKNLKTEILINQEEKSIRIKENHQLLYSIDDIDSFQLYISYGRHTGVYSFALYRYYKITFKDKNQIIVTCLMVNDIEHTLKKLMKIEDEIIHQFLCFLPFHKKDMKKL